jgi:tRNA A37 threonylcarbamoyladenosine synthetase subunit TsaC/SUA5/YrdC
MKKNYPIYLAQTDTTAGFLSKDKIKLNKIKGRNLNQSCILCAADFKDINARAPNRFKKLVRNAKKTSFILSNGRGFRVVKNGAHKMFLKKTGALYSTSANKSGKSFDIEFALSKAEVIVSDFRDFYESEPSSIIKLGARKAKKIR